MRTEFKSNFSTEIKRVTGLSGAPLCVLTGAAVATAMLGKVPTKTDLAYYLGMTKHGLDKSSRYAVDLAWRNFDFQSWNAGGLGNSSGAVRLQSVYLALAADLVTSGVYCDTDEESQEHCIAREFLNSYVKASEINTRALFSGYLICLEYLAMVARGFDMSLQQFIDMRYGRISTIAEYLQSFCDYINSNGEAAGVISQSTKYSGILKELARKLNEYILEEPEESA